MTKPVQMAFDPAGVTLPVNQILPMRATRPETRKAPQYVRLRASIQEIGVIEPLIVHPQNRTSTKANGRQAYMLLDGHTRLDILKSLGKTDVFCLIAKDDEGFTYNHKVNQVSPIQEHLMILKALHNGVSEDRIAKTLNVDVGAIRQKRDLLSGICAEAVALLKERQVTAAALRELKRVVPMRQIEMAELMVAANNFTTGYAKCLVAGTSEKDLIEAEKAKMAPGMRPEDAARMEREMQMLSRDFRLIEESHGRNTLNLVLAVGYLRKLLGNAAVTKYLAQRHPDILEELQKLVEAPDLKSAT